VFGRQAKKIFDVKHKKGVVELVGVDHWNSLKKLRRSPVSQGKDHPCKQSSLVVDSRRNYYHAGIFKFQSS
jgi:hypothetical protein